MIGHRLAHRLQLRRRDLSKLTENFCRKYSATPSSSRPFKVLFLGRDEFSVLVFKELYAASDVWKELIVATYPDEMVGRRHRSVSISPLKGFVRSIDPAIQIESIPRGKENFKLWKPPSPFSRGDAELGTPPSQSHVLVTASFGRILSTSTLSFFDSCRRLNVHPSLLPAYRGPAPIQHTLLNGEPETGVTVIEMLKRKEGLDSGQIWGMLKVAVPANETFLHLRERLGLLGGKLLVQVLRDMLAGKARRTAQRKADGPHPRAPLIRRSDAVVDFETMRAEDVVRRHRAIGHQRPLTTKIPNSQDLQLHTLSALVDPRPSDFEVPTSAAMYDPHRRCLIVRCAHDTFLSVSEVKQQGKALLDAKDWWNGVRGSAWWDGGRYVRLGVGRRDGK